MRFLKSRSAWGVTAMALAALPARADDAAATSFRMSADRELSFLAQPEKPEAETPAPATTPWRAEVTLWLWLTALSGDVRARNLSVDIDASFADIVEGSDSMFAFSGRFEAGYGPFGGFVDGFWAKLGADDQSGPAGLGSIDFTTEIALLDLGFMYRVLDVDPSGAAAANPRNLTLDLYAGARYTSVDLDLDPALLATRSRGEAWWDPIVGAKFVLPFAEQWHLAVNGDIGGFGVNADLTWSATGLVAWDFDLFNHPASLFAGYRAVSWDYSTGGGGDRFDWQVIMHGPILGFSLQF